MDIIDPIQITEAQINTYNVPLLEPLWLVDTTYSKGDIVRLDECGAVRYESLTNSNTGNDPATSVEWLKLDTPSNCYAMFDDITGTQTNGDLAIDGGDIKIKLDIGQQFSGFGFLNLAGVSEVWVKVTKTNGTVLYEQTQQIRVKNSNGWFNWLFGGYRFVPSFVDFDFPPLMGGTLEVEFRAVDGEVAKVGSFVYGSTLNIGTSLYGISLELKDFSRFDEDEFGNYVIVPRRSSNRPSFPITIDNNRFDNVVGRLRQLKTKPVLWIPQKDGFQELIVYGFYRNLRPDINHPAYVECTLQITGTPQ